MSIYSNLSKVRNVPLIPISDDGICISGDVIEAIKKLDQFGSENSMHKDVPKPKKDREVHIPVDIDTEKLDDSIKKAKKLVKLLREANELIHSL